MAQKNTLHKNERLSRKKLISEVFQRGKSISAGIFRAKFIETELHEDVPCMLMTAVPKKNVKSAVKRIRVKRLMREVYRKNKHELYDVLTDANKQIALVVIFSGVDVPDYQLTEKKLLLILQRITDKIKANH